MPGGKSAGSIQRWPSLPGTAGPDVAALPVWVMVTLQSALPLLLTVVVCALGSGLAVDWVFADIARMSVSDWRAALAGA